MQHLVNLQNRTYQTKPTQSNLPNQTYQTKPDIPNQTYLTKPSKSNLPTKPTKLDKPTQICFYWFQLFVTIGGMM